MCQLNCVYVDMMFDMEMTYTANKDLLRMMGMKDNCKLIEMVLTVQYNTLESVRVCLISAVVQAVIRFGQWESFSFCHLILFVLSSQCIVTQDFR